MIKNPSTIMKLGCVFLIAANLSMRYVHPAAPLWEDVADGINGVFYGLAIGLLLLSVWLRGRQKYSCP